MLQNALLLGGKKALKCPCDYSILVRYPVLSYHYSLWDSRYWTTSAYFQKNSKWASSSISDYACLVEVFNSPPIDCDLYLYDVYKISKSPERQQSLFFFFFLTLLWSLCEMKMWFTGISYDQGLSHLCEWLKPPRDACGLDPFHVWGGRTSFSHYFSAWKLDFNWPKTTKSIFKVGKTSPLLGRFYNGNQVAESDSNYPQVNNRPILLRGTGRFRKMLQSFS